jgi:hypothetical protein
LGGDCSAVVGCLHKAERRMVGSALAGIDKIVDSECVLVRDTCSSQIARSGRWVGFPDTSKTEIGHSLPFIAESNSFYSM